MPNAFGALGESAYGPQYRHNVAFLGGRGDAAGLAWMAEGWLRELRGARRLGTAAAAHGGEGGEPPQAAADAMGEAGVDISELEAAELEDLDPDDFDTVVALRAGGEAADADADAEEGWLEAWRRQESFETWVLPPSEDPAELRGLVKAKVEELLDSFDTLEMKAACGAGTSC